MCCIAEPCPIRDSEDPDGAAMYAIVTISVFATAIGLFIAMLSFKKKKYDEWDRQGNFVLRQKCLFSYHNIHICK